MRPPHRRGLTAGSDTRWVLALLVAMLALGLMASPARAQTGTPARFRGAVTIDGAPAFEGMIVLAQVNGNNCGSTDVRGGRYELEVASAAQKEGCGTPGATVEFVWGGLGFPGGTRAQQTGTWDQTRVTDLDLAFLRSASPIGAWLDRPPGSAATRTCPQDNQWLLLYWSGSKIAIREAVGACPNTDRFWARRGERWLGFAAALPPDASDAFEVAPGEAVFVHGAAP